MLLFFEYPRASSHHALADPQEGLPPLVMKGTVRLTVIKDNNYKQHAENIRGFAMFDEKRVHYDGRSVLCSGWGSRPSRGLTLDS